MISNLYNLNDFITSMKNKNTLDYTKNIVNNDNERNKLNFLDFVNELFKRINKIKKKNLKMHLEFNKTYLTVKFVYDNLVYKAKVLNQLCKQKNIIKTKRLLREIENIKVEKYFYIRKNDNYFEKLKEINDFIDNFDVNRAKEEIYISIEFEVDKEYEKQIVKEELKNAFLNYINNVNNDIEKVKEFNEKVVEFIKRGTKLYKYYYNLLKKLVKEKLKGIDENILKKNKNIIILDNYLALVLFVTTEYIRLEGEEDLRLENNSFYLLDLKNNTLKDITDLISNYVSEADVFCYINEIDHITIKSLLSNSL